MATQAPSSYLIIGAGVFGASTAHQLAKKYPGTSISLVDRRPYPCPLGASWDWNKVIRADYGDLFYMEKALEAIQMWRDDPLYKPFYHQSGLINIDNTGLGQQMIDNYKKLNIEVDAELVSVQDFKKRYDGFFDDTDFEGVTEVFVNEKSGWAEAAKALKALINATLELGVKYIENEVSTLTFDDTGGCTGVKFLDGNVLKADKIILSTGALTAKLIADSAPERHELQVGDRIVAGAAVTGIVSLSALEGKKYTEIPVAVHGISSTQGELMPLTAPLGGNESYTIKFARAESFKNTCRHAASHQNISMPPSELVELQSSPSAGLRARLDTVKRGILGAKADDVVIDEYRVCWDGVTPNQDFVITPHPHCKRLFIATAGSFHGWKFMPTLGRYVVEMLDGTLDPALAKRWAWDRGTEGGAHKGLLPQLELRDL